MDHLDVELMMDTVDLHKFLVELNHLQNQQDAFYEKLLANKTRKMRMSKVGGVNSIMAAKVDDDE